MGEGNLLDLVLSRAILFIDLLCPTLVLFPLSVAESMPKRSQNLFHSSNPFFTTVIVVAKGIHHGGTNGGFPPILSKHIHAMNPQLDRDHALFLDSLRLVVKPHVYGLYCLIE